jgi:hypothetical protein
MGTILNQQHYAENGQFSGGANVFPSSGSIFFSETGSFGFVAGGLYVGTTGTLVLRTVDGSVLTFASASGFIPGVITAVSSSSTCGSIIALK